MKNLILVSFQPNGLEFTAHVSLESLSLIEINPEVSLRKASSKYLRSIKSMRKHLEEMDDIKANRGVIPARKVWKFGDCIFSLVKDMEQMSFCINGLYDHLTRELVVKRMWVKKVVIFRRYIPDQRYIPRLLPWGRCSSSPRKTAKAILNGEKLL